MSRLLHLVIDAPGRRNALSRAVLSSIETALAEIDETVTGIVLSGAGDAFSSGADFAELTGTGLDVEYDDAVARVTAGLRTAPVPVVAAIEGPCVGAAADLALACDVRVAAEGSFVQVPAVRLGILYNPSAVSRLQQSYPRDAVRRLMLLGERFSADEARAAGLVSVVVPRGEAVKRSEALLEALEPEHRGSLTATKELLNDLETGDFDATAWEARRRTLLDSPERREAVERARRKHIEKES